MLGHFPSNLEPFSRNNFDLFSSNTVIEHSSSFGQSTQWEIQNKEMKFSQQYTKCSLQCVQCV